MIDIKELHLMETKYQIDLVNSGIHYTDSTGNEYGGLYAEGNNLREIMHDATIIRTNERGEVVVSLQDTPNDVVDFFEKILCNEYIKIRRKRKVNCILQQIL